MAKEVKRYYYKDQNGHPTYNLKEPLENILEDTTGYVEITKEEWDELTYVAPHVSTEEELRKKEIQMQINEYKKLLRDTDYAIIKIAESDNEEEILALRQYYSEVIAERKRVRQLINELEAQL